MGMTGSLNSSPRAQIVFTLKPARNQFIQLNGFYGNSYPELSYMNGATQQQVDMIQQKKGNPDLKQTKLTTAMGVYGIGFKRLNLQAMLLYNGADDLPLPSYFIEKDMLVQTFDGNGIWRQLNGSLSATWTPSNIFNMQAGGGYMYNRYSRVADLSAACWYATLSANIYLKDFLTSSMRHPKHQDGQTGASMTDVRGSASSCVLLFHHLKEALV